ncbi:MAG: cation diffusion facilitator family transporter, partial [Planctomycetota bacterium]
MANAPPPISINESRQNFRVEGETARSEAHLCEHDAHNHDTCHGHSHGLTQSASLSAVSDQRLLFCVVLNHLLTMGQVIGGFWSGSVALVSDAAHNFNDANALLIAYIARRISRASSNDRYTFGYRRAELIGATINLTLLAAVGFYLIIEAIQRLWNPSPIAGWLMISFA